MQRLSILLLVAAFCAGSLSAAAEVVTTVVTDADAFVETSQWGASRDLNFGANELIRLGSNPSNWVRHGYIHFDLSGIADPGLAVTEARLQVAWSSTPYDPGWTMIYAIMDEAKDWNLATMLESEITWETAPQTVPWEDGVPVVNDFEEEGDTAAAVTRELGQNDTPTATPAPIDLDVTSLVQWALGQNAAYSDFLETDGMLTVCMREGHAWSFADYYAKEYTPEDDADAPRLLITQEGGVQTPHPGDAQPDGKVDGGDYTIWADNYAKTDALPWSEGGWVVGNFTEDTNVDGGDYTIWADEYGYGTGGAAVPEPACGLLLVLGVWALRRRRRSA